MSAVSQKSQGVFRLDAPIELDQQNHITSSFSVLEPNIEHGYMVSRPLRSRRYSKGIIFESHSSCSRVQAPLLPLTLGLAESESSDGDTLVFSRFVSPKGTALRDSQMLNLDAHYVLCEHWKTGGDQPTHLCTTRLHKEERKETIYSHTFLQPTSKIIPWCLCLLRQ